MQQYRAGFGSVPALIAFGIATWIVLGSVLATVHAGYRAPAVITVTLFLVAVFALCRTAIRHEMQRKSARGGDRNGRSR